MESITGAGLTARRLLLRIAISFSLILLSCQQPTDNNPTGPDVLPLPALTVSWTDQNSVVCFGTSLTYGYGAGAKKGLLGGVGREGGGSSPAYTGDSSYPRFLGEALKIKVLNKGYVGARASYGLSIVKDSVLSKKPALVLLEFGANEFLQKVSSHQTDSVLTLLVQNILTSGAKVVLISFINPDMTRFMAGGPWTVQDSSRAIEYYAMLSGLSNRLSIPIVDYPTQGVFGSPWLMSDQFHPNGAGYMKMEQNIFHALLNTFQQNGMLK